MKTTVTNPMGVPAGDCRMRAVYLQTNQAWVVLFGDQILSIDDQSFYDTKADLLEIVESKGLKIDSNNNITSQ